MTRVEAEKLLRLLTLQADALKRKPVKRTAKLKEVEKLRSEISEGRYG